MKRYLAITKALSDFNRVRMLCALRHGELCVCQLIELVQLAPSTVSKHLSILYQADLVESVKRGRWVYYSLPDKTGNAMSQKMLAVAFEGLEDDPVIAADDEKLEEISKIDVEELCRQTKKKD